MQPKKPRYEPRSCPRPALLWFCHPPHRNRNICRPSSWEASSLPERTPIRFRAVHDIVFGFYLSVTAWYSFSFDILFSQSIIILSCYYCNYPIIAHHYVDYSTRIPILQGKEAWQSRRKQIHLKSRICRVAMQWWWNSVLRNGNLRTVSGWEQSSTK